ncbi:hypothetical protein LDENG_00164860 [Lucifuga dentata]|nr:hypothetical protein LDENG_00164860 [Lucifuga dentata]
MALPWQPHPHVMRGDQPEESKQEQRTNKPTHTHNLHLSPYSLRKRKKTCLVEHLQFLSSITKLAITLAAKMTIQHIPLFFFFFFFFIQYLSGLLMKHKMCYYIMLCISIGDCVTDAFPQR